MLLLLHRRLQMHFYTHFPQALTLCLEASGWCEFAHRRPLRASLWCPYPSFFPSLWLSTFGLSLPLTPFQIFYPSQRTASRQSASVTLLQDIQAELLTYDPGWPQTVTWFKAANKLVANYLSNTCWWRCWEFPLVKEQLGKEMKRSISIWPEIST